MINYPQIIEQLYARLSPCRLCPHRCGVDRLSGSTKGRCRTADDFSVSSYAVHKGEEPPVSGTKGSGTIFFTRCNLSCVFCQNYPISQLGNGNRTSIDELSAIMLELQEKGVHNINFVTPTHVVPQIVKAVDQARRQGLTLPLVYNSGGYEDVETLRLLDGIIDVYLPDAKYCNDRSAVQYSGADNYWLVNKAALKEMHRQVGTLAVDDKGIAKRGLIIRHLVLPEDIAGSKTILEFIAKELSPETYLSVMAQYHPAHLAHRYPALSRRLTQVEYDEVVDALEKLGLSNGWVQEL